MIIKETGYNCDRLSRGDKLIIGNGCYGYRGTLEENGKVDCVALNAASFYDQNGANWRETVNMPNPLYCVIKINGVELDPLHVVEHTEQLDMSCSTFVRTTTYNIDDVQATLTSKRFFVKTRKDLLLSSLTLCLNKSAYVQVYSGIDYDVWNISGQHFTVTNVMSNPVTVQAVTNEGKNLSVAVTEQCSIANGEFTHCDGKALNCYNGNVAQLTLQKWCLLSRDGITARKLPQNLDFAQVEKQNAQAWDKTWQVSRGIVDDTDLQQAVDYSVYQLLICAPQADDASISARGVSGQTYKGAVFWDTEMFMLPFYLKCDKEVAKRLVRYRIKGLQGAKDKAKQYGYQGAFYAWESQEGGIDACSDFNVVDVFTNRPVRTYFKDKQIHISADVAVALYKAYLSTGDLSLLTDGGMDVLLECAVFYDDYAYYNVRKNRLELLDVLGPDEYHERVNNNAYTNYMAYATAKCCLNALTKLKKHLPNVYEQYASKYGEQIKRIRKFAKLIYLPQPNEHGIIEQFDGYFNLEDVSVDTVRSRLVNPKEYWGGNTGVATPTRVIKQADVVALLSVLPDLFSADVKKANYDYYLPYTEHGSSLSASMYSLVACDVGYVDDSYQWLVKTATIDLVGGGKKFAGNVYIGGTHPAANGGTWLVLDKYATSKILPKQIQSLTLNTQDTTITVKR
ncbi:MAG: glycoside hydrolase family 65 protein [Clostridia bacterium]|nr:glycoside hydrolase family 65 protein [Clostridia bacterium]